MGPRGTKSLGLCRLPPRVHQTHILRSEAVLTASTSSAPPTISAPAFFGASAAFPSAKTSILSLALALGSLGREARPFGIAALLGIAVLMVSSYVAFGEPTSTA